jgi:aspartyl-tRNA(Asn)/glutamyl-tRNA(Gln) amidotransferase subunit A
VVADAILAGEPPIVPPIVPPAISVEALRLGVPQTYVLDGLEAEVATAFANACTMLSRAGARIVDLPLSELAGLAAINASGGFAPIEAYAWHKPLLERRGSEYDPRVRTRIERASAMTAVEYIELRAARANLITRVATRTSGFDALLMPTVAITAPPIAAFERDEDYRRLNALLLRNTSVINFLDCCAITVPVRTAGPPVGLMIVGEHGADHHLLGIARGIEAAVKRSRR